MKNILCFGDSNTWGYNPRTKERFSSDIRWTGVLQKNLGNDVKIIEEGLCGRTTVYEDETRPDRKGIDSIPGIFERNERIDAVIIMLGTNDCKRINHTTPRDIAMGIDSCLDVILKQIPSDKVLLVSPINLGDDVWKDEYDPEFDKKSVLVSRQLKQEYRKVAKKRGVYFLAASDYVAPSKADQEHLDEEGHRVFADAITGYITRINRMCA